MALDPLRERIDSFLTALEEEKYQIELAARRPPRLGRLYEEASSLLSVDRITDVQRVLAGAGGVEERQIRALLEFLARGRAMAGAGGQLDRRLEWEVFGSVEVGESRIPHRQIPAALGIAADPERRHTIEEAHYVTLDDQHYLAEDFLTRHRDAISELGYGSHVDAFQILGNIDLHATAREGERFLAESRAAYFDLLGWYLPRVTGVSLDTARAGDARRIEAAAEYDGVLPGGDRNRRVVQAIGATGLDPLAEGRIRPDWEAFLGSAVGAVSRPIQVPGFIRLAVSTRSGRPAVASFLHAYGVALQHAYTRAELPVEQRRLGDDSVAIASGELFVSLLQNPAFLSRIYDFPKARLGDFLRLSSLIRLLGLRREIARLLYEIAFYSEGAGGDHYADLLTAATGMRHDPRGAAWAVDPEFTTARRIRGSQLGTAIGDALRSRFDEDWFRNPRAGDYLRELYAGGRRYSAPELSVQLTSRNLGYEGFLDS